jgi:hypothetical protein
MLPSPELTNDTHMTSRLLGLLFVTGLLAGCVTVTHDTTPRYVLPDGAPYAMLKTAMTGISGRHESVSVEVFDGECGSLTRKKLFYISDSKSWPEGYVKVVAGKPLILKYYETAAASQSCEILMQVQLQEGKNYSLVGGPSFKDGVIPILPGKRMCQFGVKDESTGSFTPYTQSFCYQ